MKKVLLLAALAVVSVVMVSVARADTVWTQWDSGFTAATPGGAATGTMGGVTVTYSGELENLIFGYPSWTAPPLYMGPPTYIGGPVTSAPPPAGGIIQLFGGQYGATDTITFSSPVINPAMAIWSLGSGGDLASFNFTAMPTIVAGGPSAEYLGSSITQTGNNIYGAEGNGTVVFYGTFNSITWTNPSFEDWYGFTVGTAQVPEPSSVIGASGLGLMGLLGLVWRRRKVA